LKTIIDAGEVEQLQVLDTDGIPHTRAPAGAELLPYCAVCRRPVEKLCHVVVQGLPRWVYVVRCHGDQDVVRWLWNGPVLVAQPAFQNTPEERQRLMLWLSAGAPEDAVFS
jgi:hypothetical protein